MPIDRDSSELAQQSQMVLAQQQAGEVTVEELRESREGSGSGVQGSYGTVRRFMVRNFPINQDPRDALRNHPDGVREGNSAPYTIDSLNGMVAVLLVESRRVTPGAAIVEVLYGPPIFIPSLPEAWQIDFEGGLETEEVEFDLVGKPVGTPKYEVMQISSEAAPAGATHFADYGGGTKVWLKPSVTDKRYVEPMPRTKDVFRIVLWKRVGVLNEVLIGLLVDAHNSVNEDNLRFLSIYKTTPLLLGGRNNFHWVGSSINAEPGTAAGQNIPGMLFRVTVVLEYSEHGHQWKIPHRLTDSETGERTLIRSRTGNEDDPTPVVTETFKRYKTKNFTSILSQF